MPLWKANPGILKGKDAKEEDMSLKLARNFSCSSPDGSKLIIMLPITLRVNCTRKKVGTSRRTGMKLKAIINHLSTYCRSLLKDEDFPS